MTTRGANFDKNSASEAEFTIINCPNFRASPEKHGCNSETLIVINFQKKMAIICGTEYAGEIKKIVFTILNYLLPERDVMPMHCSATQEKEDPSNVTIFLDYQVQAKQLCLLTRNVH